MSKATTRNRNMLPLRMWVCSVCGRVETNSKQSCRCRSCGSMMRKFTQKNLCCPYCGSIAPLHRTDQVFPNLAKNRPEYVYVCNQYPACNSYVFAHSGTKIPAGSIANTALRRKRWLAHCYIEEIVKHELQIDGRYASKDQVYKWIAFRLGVSLDKAHIGVMSEVHCDATIDLLERIMIKNGLDPKKATETKRSDNQQVFEVTVS